MCLLFHIIHRLITVIKKKNIYPSLAWQEILLQRVMSQIASVKKDMIILEKSEFSTLLAENEVSGSI